MILNGGSCTENYYFERKIVFFFFSGRRLRFRIDVKRNLCPPNRRFAFPNDNFEDNDSLKILSETSRRYVI